MKNIKTGLENQTVGEVEQSFEVPGLITFSGAIELSILSPHYKTEIAVVDSQTTRMDVYGEGSGYKQVSERNVYSQETLGKVIQIWPCIYQFFREFFSYMMGFTTTPSR